MNIRKNKDANETGCEGLLEGVARVQSTGKPVYASQCTKEEGPFLCGECFSDAVLRKCTEKIDHFAHHCRVSPTANSESKLHSDAKNEICELLSALYPSGKWECEREIPAKPQEGIGKLKPDISGRINGEPVAIEIQASTLSISKILKRTSEYAKRKIALCWIIPLSEPLGDELFRPRLFERYIHSLYFGRTYYWTRGSGLMLTPVHFGKAVRHIEVSAWYEDGELQEAGGYDKTYKILKTPIYGSAVNLTTQFKKQFRGSFIPENERKAIPECCIWRDELATWWNQDSTKESGA